MIDAQRPAGVISAPRRTSGRGTPTRTWIARATALVAALAILLTVAQAGHPLGIHDPFALQARATALHDRWGEMVGEGVPAQDLEQLNAQWAQMQRVQLIGVPLFLWWPDSKRTIDGWQAQTDTIWRRDLQRARAAASVSDESLHAAFGADPDVERATRLAALAQAVTPAELQALSAQWDLQARLVPLDRTIAADVAALQAQVTRASALGILTVPAPAVLGRAADYAGLTNSERLAASAALVADLESTALDLGARVDAAGKAVAAYGRAVGAISSAGTYDIDTSAFQSSIDAASGAFWPSTTVAEFDAVTTRLDAVTAQVNAQVEKAKAARSASTNSGTNGGSGVIVISGITYYRQIHALSCEEAAVQMALTHQGIYVSQDQILAEIGSDRRPMYVDSNGIVRWGNPYLTFVGDVNGDEKNYTGYQANYPPLVNMARAHGARIIAAGPMSASYIYSQLAAGHPVVVWATDDWAWHPRHDYLSFDGVWIPSMGPDFYSHVYTAVGVAPGAVLVNDPIRGQYWVTKGAFAAAYSVFGEAIVFA